MTYSLGKVMSHWHMAFTGTRNGMKTPQGQRLTFLFQELREVPHVGWGHFGVCKGADRQAFDLWHHFGGRAIGHPPTNIKNMDMCPFDELREPKDYHVRDRDMVDESHFLIAAPNGMTEELRSGTWTTVRYARKLKRPIIYVFPDGSMTGENWESL